MSLTFDTVDNKIAEAEFFLQKMCGCSHGKDFNWYFSAFLSAARTSTLALQRFKDAIPGFQAWYEPHRQRMATNDLAKAFLDMRNDHVHGGPYPVSGSMSHGRTVEHYFRQNDPRKSSAPGTPQVVQASTEYFVDLLEIVHDCYVKLGVHFDPQQYYTKENYPGRDIDAAECEVCGWVCTSLIKEGFTKDDRWNELRGRVAECFINHLFRAYLDKITPQPVVPEHCADFKFSEEDEGWTHVPAGYSSVAEYRRKFRGTTTVGLRGPKPKTKTQRQNSK
ncbi:MAG TPA: hypothetical protein VGM73_10365 [Candidatus Didemnitutus sp.]|jgi:hypothetical protein